MLNFSCCQGPSEDPVFSSLASPFFKVLLQMLAPQLLVLPQHDLLRHQLRCLHRLAARRLLLQRLRGLEQLQLLLAAWLLLLLLQGFETLS